MSEAKKRAVALIEELAVPAFKNHKIRQVMSMGVHRHFKCLNRSGSSNYMFRVVTFPGRLVITGDIGDLMLCREIDMLPWAKRAVESIDYFAEKVVAGKVKQYCPEVVQEEINEVLAERVRRLEEDAGEDDVEVNPDDLESPLDLTDIDNPHTTLVEMYYSGLWDGCDFPNTENWTSNFLWCREALRWFFREYDKRLTC